MSLTEGLSKGLSLPSVSRRGFLEVNAKLAAAGWGLGGYYPTLKKLPL